MTPGGQERSDRGMTQLAPLTDGAAVLVTGAGITGRALLATLQPLGARATLTADSPTALQQFAQSGVAVIDPAAAVDHIVDYDLVLTSPGFAPSAPVLCTALRRW